jgi:hypothetical protein
VELLVEGGNVGVVAPAEDAGRAGDAEDEHRDADADANARGGSGGEAVGGGGRVTVGVVFAGAEAAAFVGGASVIGAAFWRTRDASGITSCL